MKENNIDFLMSKMALDALEGQPVVFDLDKHWFLNSKAALATSGLSTPKADIIEVVGYAPAAKYCCESCRSGDTYYVSSDCKGARSKWLDQQVKQTLDRVTERSLPFVLKLQQSFGGAGTNIVTNEEERSKLVENLLDDILRKLYSGVTLENHHLKPGTIILTDMVENPIRDCGLTFSVSASGDVTFLAVSDQIFDSMSQVWIGSIIDYSLQKQFQQRFSPIMDDIAKWLHSYGYCGLAGADLLETEHDSINGAPRQTKFHIVDLNVRISGSLMFAIAKKSLHD